MKSYLVAGLILSSSLCATQAFAEEGKFNIGLASKSLFIDNDFLGSASTWGGLAIVGGYDFTDYISLNGALYTLTEETNSNSEISGFEADVRLGPNSLGFTYYGTVGYFSDTWNGSISGFSENYSGSSFGFGIGYNWENINLNWTIFTLRSSSSNTTTSGTGSLGLAYRF